ncbi:DsbA family protein [Flavobacterium silvaticum]|uniref:Thioredoxin domain-containing protein n=1 Tax=Flavobacterium silvaticum TaxID=1852020 RepID=A0A972FTR4_9FLAO|nr:thioredoxin domain-containing protein [Flavobacterium silvaticum]NMH27425.1 thioredoxin domain-containing protein [Flavobacterium silvaticum]
MALRKPVDADDHIEGNIHAAIELVEYGDYQCPHCQKAYYIVKRWQREFGDNLKLVFRNFPLENIHPLAKPAAIATEAAARQGKFWEMHDHLFENHDDFSRGKLVQFAEELGLNVTDFSKDLEDPELSAKVDADFYGGMRSGVNATPTFFVNGEKFEGSWDTGELRDFLQNLI